MVLEKITTPQPVPLEVERILTPQKESLPAISKTMTPQQRKPLNLAPTILEDWAAKTRAGGESYNNELHNLVDAQHKSLERLSEQ